MRISDWSPDVCSSDLRQLWGDHSPAQTSTKQALSSEDRGWYAVQFIKAEGYDFLGQFVMNAKADVSWSQTERVLEGTNSLFEGGLKGMETKLRGEETNVAGEVGRAGREAGSGGGGWTEVGRVWWGEEGGPEWK